METRTREQVDFSATPVAILADVLIATGTFFFAYKSAQNAPLPIESALPVAVGVLLYLVLLGRRASTTHVIPAARTVGLVATGLVAVRSKMVARNDALRVIEKHRSTKAVAQPPIFQHFALKAGILFAGVVLVLAISR